MKKQKLIKKMMIALTVFVISIKSVNANENQSNDFSQKLKDYFNFFHKYIQREIKETKEFQVKKWKEAKNQHDKTFEIVNQKLTGFFSDFPNPKGD